EGEAKAVLDDPRIKAAYLGGGGKQNSLPPCGGGGGGGALGLLSRVLSTPHPNPPPQGGREEGRRPSPFASPGRRSDRWWASRRWSGGRVRKPRRPGRRAP